MEKLMPILYPGIALLAFIIPLSINKRGIIAIAATILPAMGLTNAAYDQYATLADLLPSRNVVPLTRRESAFRRRDVHAHQRSDRMAALQNFQAAHHGVAPIVFSIDATGSTNGNPLCIHCLR